MSSDLYIDGFVSSDRTYDEDNIETKWIGHLGTCTYFGFHLTDLIDEYVHRNCFMYGPARFIKNQTTGEIYQDPIGSHREYSENNHIHCNKPMTVEDVEALVKIFDDLYKHWQHLNSLTDEEFKALGYGYMRPTPERVKEDIFSGEEIREGLLTLVGLYWNTRCD